MRDKAGLVYIYKKNRKVGVIQKDLIMYVTGMVLGHPLYAFIMAYFTQ